MNHSKHLVIRIRHDESTHSTDCEIHVVNRIALVVEKRRVSEQLLFQARGYPRKESWIFIVHEDFKLFEILFVYLLANFEPQMHWQLRNEKVKTRILCLRIVLQCPSDVKYERFR